MLKKTITKRTFFTLGSYILIMAILIIIHQVHAYHKARSDYDDLRKAVCDGDYIDWEKLKGTDTVAWIRIPGAPGTIDYPIEQHPKDDQYYLWHMFNKKENICGSIMVEHKANKWFGDKNTIIHGHNMKDKSMFWALRYFMDPTYWKNNKEMYIYFPDGTKRYYEVFRSAQVNEYSATYRTQFNSENEFVNYIINNSSNNMVPNDTILKKSDRIITMSTCLDTVNSNRMVVQAVERRVEKIQEPASWLTEEDYEQNPHNLKEYKLNVSSDASSEASGNSKKNKKQHKK